MRGYSNRKLPVKRLQGKTKVKSMGSSKAKYAHTLKETIPESHVDLESQKRILNDYEQALMDEFPGMRGFLKAADLHSVFTRCHALVDAAQAAAPKNSVNIPMLSHASLVALVLYGASTSSRLKQSETDALKPLLVKRKGLRMKEVAMHQCAWVNAVNQIPTGEGKLLCD